ncbi:MAG: transposase zinc-binding domain-containing protein [Planctomycetes bacterium]|nr:transposase zinc-binding domain-containing protein [Planctomycetota bacterium]
MEPAALHAHPARPYERRRPETTALHQVVREHLATFLQRRDDAPDRNPFPSFIRREFHEYLTCGLLAAGFLRVHCPSCKQDALVAFSCKRRGFCPSCCARRMSDTAAHLVERVLPEAPIRQWVFTLPHPLRFRLAYDPQLLRAVRRVFTRTVLAFYRRHLRTPQSPRTQSGAVVFVQRFGSALDLNVHLHALFLDGAYTAQDVVSPPRFRPLERLTDEYVAKLVAQLQRRVLPVLETHDAPDEDELTALETCYAASIRKRRAFGPHAGTSIACIRTHPQSAPELPTPLCASLDGFTLHPSPHSPSSTPELSPIHGTDPTRSHRSTRSRDSSAAR